MGRGKGPSMSWTPENKLALLIKYIGQNPNMTYDAEEISRTWEGDPKPTARAVRNTLADIRAKAIADAGGVAPRLPRASNTPNSASRSVTVKRPATAGEVKDDDENVIKNMSGANSTAFSKRLSATANSPAAKRVKCNTISKDKNESALAETTTDSDVDADVTVQPDIKSTPRKTPDRRSKTPKKYTDDDDDDADGDAPKQPTTIEDEDEDEDFDYVAARRAEQGRDKPRKSFSQRHRAKHTEDVVDIED